MIGIAIVALAMYTSHWAHVSRRTARPWTPPERVRGLALGQLLMAALGVLTITSEFSSGMIRATFAAAPSRPLVLAAKAAVLGAAARSRGEVVAFAGFLAGQAAVAARPRTPPSASPACCGRC